MSVAGVNPSRQVDAAADPPPWWATPGFIAGAAIITAALVFFFRHWLYAQHQKSWGNDDWAHAYIVPVISGYAAWRVRDQLRALRPEVFAPGLAPLALGVVCYIFFTLGFPTHMGRGFSIVLTIFGLALLNLGPKITALLAFPIAYLAFAVTLSNYMIRGVLFELQLIASQGAWILLNMVGIQTDVSGNTLTIMPRLGEPIPLDVAEACSGMRMVIAFVALGAAVAFISTPRWWQRIALLTIAAPVAIFVNILRVASLGALSLWDPEFAKGNAHMMVGVAWLIPAFLLFMGCAWALLRAGGNDREEAPA